MREQIIFKRRNRIKQDVVIISKVLLYGYNGVSDSAKITYQVIDGFDWEDKETKSSKGYAFPATETLAEIRDTSVRTIERHIRELVAAKLLTRVRQRNLPSILYIEDVSEREINKYLTRYVNPPKRTKNKKAQSGSKKSSNKLSTSDQIETSEKSRNDKNVVSHEASETTKMSFAYMKENEGKENEINVNENFKKEEQKRTGQTNSIGELLKSYQLSSSTKNSKPDQELKRDVLAEQLAEKLNDQKSLGCYRVIAEKVPQQVIFQTLGNVKETAAAGEIRKSRGALFVEMIKKYSESHGIELGFQTEQQVYETWQPG